MVTTKTLLGLAIANVFTIAYAGSCKTFTLYCGHTLKNGRGWTNKEIQDKVFIDQWNDHKYPDDAQIDQSLFKCGGQGESLVWVNSRTPCSGHCEDSKSSASDYCA